MECVDAIINYVIKALDIDTNEYNVSLTKIFLNCKNTTKNIIL
jgi:hypothetical protein